MLTVKIKKNVMLDILYGLKEDIFIDRIIGHSRWALQYEFIFKYNNKIYRTVYDIGATEYQDIGPWDNQDEVECIEVAPVRVSTIEYKPIEDVEDEANSLDETITRW